jgi:hypothetical protein
MRDRLAWVVDGLRRIGVAIAWTLAFAVIAFGSAGIASAMAHPPAGLGRPELTWAGDLAIRPSLDAATDDLVALSEEVDALALLGRGALAALAGSDWELLDETVSNGSTVVLGIRADTAALQASLVGLPGMGGDVELNVSAATIERHRRLVDAAGVTQDLARNWASIANGSLSAARLSTLLTRHDELVVAAIEAQLARDFTAAIERIDEATAQLDEAKVLRDRLANAVDVATLDEWLRRNRDYDTALKALYVASAASPDRVTPELRAALAAEAAARAQLPRTTRNLVIIMGEIGRGGLNQAVIAIDSARGRLSTALQALGVHDTP